MRHIWFLLIVILVISCKNDVPRHSNLMSMVPNQASVVIKTSSVEGLINVFNNNSLLKQFSDKTTISGIDRKLDFLKHISPSEDLLLAFGTDKQDSIQVSVITKYHQDLLKFDSIRNYSVETLPIQGSSLTKTTIEDQIIYSIVKDSIFFASNDRALTEAAVKQKNTDPLLEELFQTTSYGETLSIFMNMKEESFQPNLFFDEQLNQAQLTNYFLLDADLTQDQLKFDGITIAKDSSKSLINVFKNTLPQENKLPRISPPDSDGFLSFSFHNFKTFQDNLSKFRKRDSIIDESVFESILEAGVIYRNDEQAVFLNSIDATNLNTFFGEDNNVDTYRGVSINTFDKPELFVHLFSPFITYTKSTKFINIDDFFVFSDDIGFLKDIISSYQNNATLYTAHAFEVMMENLSNESSLLAYANTNHLKHILNSNFKNDNMINADGFNSSAFQMVYETDFAHVHAILQNNKKRPASNTVYEDISVTLDADVLNNPQFVNNHTNHQVDVVVQDVHNNLYLISTEGKVQWKKQLDSKVLGRIEQIDINKNGRLQLAFATERQVYVLDRNGKDVGVFPLKFRDQITQPLSVFDYENNRNYRLMVTQGAEVLLYNKQGKIVRGFNFRKAKNNINSQPQHLRIGRKDYIVFVQGNELEILNRVGKTRVNVTNNISFSDSGIYLYDNKFTTTTVKGDLVQIDENGKMSSSNLSLGEKHSIAATTKTLVTLSENILHIKTNKVELDFGDYTPPKIFYVNDKIYVSVTDLQAKKVYLFDSLGKSIANFPVYGNSAIDLDNTDRGKSPGFVTKGGQNSIIIYQIN